MVAGETKLCPVCDAPLEPGVQRCPECNTDLSLFDLGGEIPELAQGPSASGQSIDDILNAILSGKDVSSDFFEDIKTIAKEGEPPEDDILAELPEKVSEEVPKAAADEFECPNCGTRVSASASVCPGCGVHFAEEAIRQFECPLCGATVDAAATNCPNCGVRFAEEEAAPPPEPPTARAIPAMPPPAAAPRAEVREPARAKGAMSPLDRLTSLLASRAAPAAAPPLDKASLYKELPRLVNEVKPLLLVAKKVGVEIEEERDLISDAIAHGKRRDVERAVSLIRDAKWRLDREFTTQIGQRVQSILEEAEQARTTGTDLGAVETMCTAAIEALEARNYPVAAERLRAAREEFEIRSGGPAKAREGLAHAEALFADAKKLGLAVPEAETFLARSRQAIGANDFEKAAGLAVQARQAILRLLPDALAKEMKKARDALLEMKVKGGDLTKPVGILKQASIHIKREEYADAARFVRMFHEELGVR